MLPQMDDAHEDPEASGDAPVGSPTRPRRRIYKFLLVVVSVFLVLFALFAFVTAALSGLPILLRVFFVVIGFVTLIFARSFWRTKDDDPDPPADGDGGGPDTGVFAAAVLFNTQSSMGTPHGWGAR